MLNCSSKFLEMVSGIHRMVSSGTYSLGQNKMERQTPITTPKSRMKPREGQKRAIFPSLIWGGGGGGSRFSIYFVQDCSLPSRHIATCKGMQIPESKKFLPNYGIRNPRNICLWNPKSGALESGIQLKASKILLTGK